MRPTEPEEADYDTVPIEDYGMAMLRGMGWEQGAGIGLTHKAHVEAKIPQLRPKGLGLGADKALVQALKKVPRTPSPPVCLENRLVASSRRKLLAML